MNGEFAFTNIPGGSHHMILVVLRVGQSSFGGLQGIGIGLGGGLVLVRNRKWRWTPWSSSSTPRLKLFF
jgi:hypothetical protein